MICAAGISRGGCRPQTVRVAKVGRVDLATAFMSMEVATLGGGAARFATSMSSSICPGVLQDGPGSDTTAVHCDFRRAAGCRHPRQRVRYGWCISRFPGTTENRPHRFSTTKREAERLDRESGVAFTILPARLRGGRLRPMAAAPWCARSRRIRSIFSPPNGPPIPADRHGGHCRDHRLACGARSF